MSPPMRVVSDVTSREDAAADPGTPGPPPVPRDAEALIKEAHQRKRRRRLVLIVVVIVILGLVGIGFSLLHSTTSPASTAKRTSPRTTKATTPTQTSTTAATLDHPYGITVAPNGALYVADIGRDQVLRRLSTGRFVVVAGNGHRGFSGDGGSAGEAELSLSDSSGLAVSRNGTLYIADSGNDRVREVLPDGTIETVAGNGNSGMVLSATPALQASLGEVSGLAIGPDGNLYVAASNVVQLTPTGIVEWVAGNNTTPESACAIECDPASEWDFTEPDQLAFDGAGDLLVSDGNGFDLYEIAADGHPAYLGGFRGDGAPGALAAAPGGSVVEAWRGGLTRWVPDGQTSSIAANLDKALGPNNVFIAGDGIAVGANSNIYLDTNTGNTFTAVNALVAVSPTGAVSTLWRS